MKKVKCILLVDDNADDNFFHSLAIKELDAAEEIKTAANGEKALEYLENSVKDPANYPPPDIIFLDINMPRINGFEFLEKATEKNLLRNPVIIVFLTSSLNPADVQTAKHKFEKHIKEYITKPLTAEALKKIMETYVS